MNGGPQDGIAYLLRIIERLTHDLTLAKNEIRRQRNRAELYLLRLEHDRAKKGKVRHQ